MVIFIAPQFPSPSSLACTLARLKTKVVCVRRLTVFGQCPRLSWSSNSRKTVQELNKVRELFTVAFEWTLFPVALQALRAQCQSQQVWWYTPMNSQKSVNVEPVLCLPCSPCTLCKLRVAGRNRSKLVERHVYSFVNVPRSGRKPYHREW